MGAQQKKIVLDYDVGLSTIYDINKTADSLAKYRTENPFSSTRSTLKESHFPLLFLSGISVFPEQIWKKKLSRSG